MDKPKASIATGRGCSHFAYDIICSQIQRKLDDGVEFGLVNPPAQLCAAVSEGNLTPTFGFSNLVDYYYYYIWPTVDVSKSKWISLILKELIFTGSQNTKYVINNETFLRLFIRPACFFVG